DLNVIKEGLPRSAYFTEEVIGARFNDAGEYIGNLCASDTVEGGAACGSADADRQFLGVPFPEHFGSFSLNVRLFGGLNIYSLADYALGHRVFNSTKAFGARFGNNPERNELAEQLDALTPGTAEYIDAADRYALTDWAFDSNYLEDADYLKLREITVTYDFADLYARATGRTDVRSFLIGLSARNVYTTSKYSNPDPEVNFTGARSLSRGQDFLTLQNPRALYFTVSLGI
ncbi:MAG TPA: hypothetical protein VKP65_15715, partial [Rhodothermales bacterium]|nr:hypothetical protein [Rhodothermales bacterium]